MASLIPLPPPDLPPKKNASSIHSSPATPSYLMSFWSNLLWTQSSFLTLLHSLELPDQNKHTLTSFSFAPDIPLFFRLQSKTVPWGHCFLEASQVEATCYQLSFMSMLGNGVSITSGLTVTSRPLVLYLHWGIKNPKALLRGVLVTSTSTSFSLSSLDLAYTRPQFLGAPDFSPQVLPSSCVMWLRQWSR